jgi:hypothetical protein
VPITSVTVPPDALAEDDPALEVPLADAELDELVLLLLLPQAPIATAAITASNVAENGLTYLFN